MTKINLTVRQCEIMRSLGDRLPPVERQHVDRLLDANVDLDEIDALCRIINDEYLMEGIEEDYRPNEYGQELQTLLNVVNMPRLVK